MGIFWEKVKIINPEDKASSLEVEMVADSGATYTQVPEVLLKQLGIKKRFKRCLKIATGEVIERGAGLVELTIKGETLPTVCIFGDEGSEPLLGAVTLEEFGLGVDPVNKTLVPVPELML